MINYINLLTHVWYSGVQSDDRTGTGTQSLFSKTLEFDMNEGFPLVTTKYTNYSAVLKELLWFIQASTNIKTLDSKIWDAWADEEGNIGQMYGYQWKQWGNQLQKVIQQIKDNPYSRRHVVSAWNVDNLPDEKHSPQENVKLGKMALAPCHHFFQFYVREGELSLHFSMRSSDIFLGLPFNIASYATLLQMVAQLTDLELGRLSYHGVDVHLYNNHKEQVFTQINRTPYELPTLEIKKRDNIEDFVFEDFNLIDYVYHPRLKGAISV